jgi:mannose-6-phosphate isomerase-like protein (cupin superfamily)
MAQNIYVGNADIDGPLNRGWLLGHFMPESDVRHSQDVEIKWGVHPAGEERAQWVTHEERTSLHVLISGRFLIHLPDQTVELAKPGDYVVLHRTGHSWRSEEPSVILSVRWPSVPGYAVPVADVPA